LSSRRSSRLLASAAVAGALLLPGPVGAFDVKLWPLFRYVHDPVTDDLRWSALGPVIEFSRTADARDLRIRPVLWLHQKRGPSRDDRSDILFPLAATRWTDEYQSFRFLLFTYRATTPRASATSPPAATRFTLFPFVFYRETPDGGRHLSVLPFYLDLPDVFGYEEVKAVMFPAYVRLTEARVERRFYGFPFVSTVGGADGHGFRFWPFFGTKEIAGRERTRYVLWPFHLRSERLVPGYGWETRRIDFPVFASIDGPTRHSRGYGIFAHVHTVDERLGTESTGAPWPFVFRERRLGEESYRTWRVAPFYGRSDRDGISSRFYAWPAYRTRDQDEGDFHYRHRDALLVLWRSQEQWNEASRHHESVLTLFPVLRLEEADGRHFGQVPALADSLMPRNRGVLAMWAPVYGLVRWDSERDGERDWSVLWGLVARERGQMLGPWHLDPDPDPQDAHEH
jgi:hypothetical protein